MVLLVLMGRLCLLTLLLTRGGNAFLVLQRLSVESHLPICSATARHRHPNPRVGHAMSRCARVDVNELDEVVKETVYSSRNLAASTPSPSTKRRRLLFGWGVLWATVMPSHVVAASESSDSSDETLTTRLFNPDGSLKDATMEIEAKTRLVSWQWNNDSTRPSVVDGVVPSSPTSDTTVSVSYELPQKWNNQYVDSSYDSTESSCRRIAVFATPASNTPLSKATRVGLAQTLNLPDDALQAVLSTADLISGRTVVVVRNQRDTSDTSQTYFEFDLAVAPKTCSGGDADDLRLGFCPYDRIVLVSATTLQNVTYICTVQADRLQWKRANAELKRIRSSFRVTS